MRRKGRPPAWTSEQREQVVALAKKRVTQREIAKRVFGHERYRGRVERILREEAESRATRQPVPELTQDELDAFDVSDVSVARDLVARYERSLAESEEVPPLADIERLLRLKRQIAAAEFVRRANTNTRPKP